MCMEREKDGFKKYVIPMTVYTKKCRDHIKSYGREGGSLQWEELEERKSCAYWITISKNVHMFHILLFHLITKHISAWFILQDTNPYFHGHCIFLHKDGIQVLRTVIGKLCAGSALHTYKLLYVGSHNLFGEANQKEIFQHDLHYKLIL